MTSKYYPSINAGTIALYRTEERTNPDRSGPTTGWTARIDYDSADGHGILCGTGETLPKAIYALADCLTDIGNQHISEWFAEIKTKSQP